MTNQNQSMSSPEDDRDGPIFMKSFLDENHRVFTVIGVFAALAVYLSQLGEPTTEALRLGVGASLFLFLLSIALGTHRSYQALERVRKDPSLKTHLWVLPYSVFMYSLLFLGLSVILVINRSYPNGVGGILASSIIYSLIFVYWTIVTTSSKYENIDGKSAISGKYSLAPYLAVFPSLS